MSERARLILNSHSRCGGAVGEELRGLAEGAGVGFVVSERPGEAASLANRALDEGVRRLIVAGGDGTLHEVLNGIGSRLDGEVELAPIACGTGNDFARSVGFDLGWSWERQFREAVENGSVVVDVGEVVVADRQPRLFLNGVSGGVAGEVNEEISEEMKRFWGGLAYWVAGAQRLGGLSEYAVELTVDGRELRVDALQLAVANGRTVGGGFPVAPDAVLGDGLLDVVVAPAQSALEAVGSLLSLGFGRHREAENLLFLQGKSVEVRASPELVWSVDGECEEPAGTARFSVKAGALRGVVCAGAPGV